MIIKRSDNSVIKKRKINLNHLDLYDEEKIKLAEHILNEEIYNGYVSHFDYVSYVFEGSNNHNDFWKYNRNSGCVSDCRRLRKKLKKEGMKTYFVSCKANGFSNPIGDSLVCEGHVFLVYPSLKNNRVYFTIFDPGFRINRAISFYDLEGCLFSDNGINVNYMGDDSNYPYEMTSNKREDYKRDVIDADLHWKFNPYYETLNLDLYNAKLYSAMFYLKLMNYPIDINKYIYIRSKLLEETIEIYMANKSVKFTFNELSKFSQEELVAIFEVYFFQAGISYKELKSFVKNVFLLIHNVDKYIKTVLDLKVIEEYKLGYRLNR